MKEVKHLYVHIPFCRRRCSYCSFYSETDSQKLAQPYVNALLAEAGEFTQALEQIETLYLGGGTPTLLGARLLGELLEGLGGLLAPGAEVSVEANPGSLDAAVAEAMLAAGITRVSLGAQSFSPRLRQNLGRHDSGSSEEAVDILRSFGFDNIGIDLIFGIPGQDVDDLESDIRQALELAPTHISYYELSVDQESAFEKKWRQELEEARRQGADDNLLVVDRLEAAGYRWYETSNFAQPGYECAHNLAYWAGRDYIGLGAGAWSTVGKRRWRNVADIGRYLNPGLSLESLRHLEKLSEGQKAAELLFLGLRRADGVSREPLEDALNHSAEKQLLDNGFLANEGGRIKLTRPGRMMANDICARLLQE